MDRIYTVLNEIQKGTKSAKELFAKVEGSFKNNLVDFQIFLNDIESEVYIRFLGGNTSPAYGDIILTDKGKGYIKDNKPRYGQNDFMGPCKINGKMKCKEHFLTNIDDLCNTCFWRTKIESVRANMIMKFETLKSINTKEYIVEHLKKEIKKDNKKIAKMLNIENQGWVEFRENRVGLYLSYKDCVKYYTEQLKIIETENTKVPEKMEKITEDKGKEQSSNIPEILYSVDEVYFIGDRFSIGTKEENGIFQVNIWDGNKEYIAKAKNRIIKEEYENWYWKCYNTEELQDEMDVNIYKHKKRMALNQLAVLLNDTNKFDISVPVEKIELLVLKAELDTLGLSGTASKNKAQSGEEVFLKGKGIDIGNITVMERRAKRKLITKTLAMLLIPMAKADENWKWEARFTRTLHCQDELTEAERRTYSPYCNERCCTICLANRKSEKIKLYLPIVEDMPDPHFLTITAQSVRKDGLKIRVHETAHAIRTIIARYKKRSERGKGIKFYGIWCLESNFNPFKWTYNPHIHMILPSEYAAQTFLNDWMEYWKERGVKVDRKGQHYRRLNKDRQRDLIEIVKYGSKIFTEPDIAERIKFGLPKKPSFMYVRALYNILLAMDGLDVFNTFGFTLPKRKKPRRIVKTVTDSIDWYYDLAAPDWINEDLGLRLAKYKVPDDLEALLTSRVNTDFE